MNRTIINFLTALFLTSLPTVCRAQDFSADVVYVAPDGVAASSHEPSKLFVTKGKMRLETHGITGTILLVDYEAGAAMVLYPGQKAFQPLASGPTQYFHVEDAENACPDWQKASDRKLDCEKVGHETVDGRQTVKYKNKAATPASPLSTIWIDPTVNFVVKWEDSKTGAELRHITQEEKLSSALFEVPAGYDQMKPKKKGPKSGAGPKGGASR